MVFTRDLDPDEHVYANPLSSFIQQAGKASRRVFTRLMKKIKQKARERQTRKRHRTPSFVQVPPCPDRRGTSSPTLCDYKAPDTSSHHMTKGSKTVKLYRHQEGNRSYESMSQINPLTRLYVTNPDPTSPVTADDLSTRSNIALKRARRKLPPSHLFRISSGPSRTNWPLEDIPEESIQEPILESTIAETESQDWSLTVGSAQKWQHIDELWFTPTSAETARSPSVPSSNQDQVFAPPTSLPPSSAMYSQSPKGSHFSSEFHPSVIAPIRTLRPTRYRIANLPPRIPSLYFRAGSPFADGDLPWNQTSQF